MIVLHHASPGLWLVRPLLRNEAEIWMHISEGWAFPRWASAIFARVCVETLCMFLSFFMFVSFCCRHKTASRQTVVGWLFCV